MQDSLLDGKSDKEICDLLLAHDKIKVSQVLEALYIRFYKDVEKYILSKGGSSDEAKDIYQEGMTAFYVQVKKGKFRQEAKIKTYVIAICKNIWFREIKKRKPRVELSDSMFDPEELKIDINTERPNDLTYDVFQIFKQLKEDCQKILELYYFEKYSMQAIAKEFNFASVQSAKNKKMKCLNYLRQKIKTHLSLG